jgi:hypothetical protein
MSESPFIPGQRVTFIDNDGRLAATVVRSEETVSKDTHHSGRPRFDVVLAPENKQQFWAFLVASAGDLVSVEEGRPARYQVLSEPVPVPNLEGETDHTGVVLIEV